MADTTPNVGENNDATGNESRMTRLRGIKRGTSNLVDGADGSIFWLIKWCAQQLALAAEAISQQLMSAQSSAERRIADSRREED